MSLFEPIFEALNRAQIRYVVVGGFATVADIDWGTSWEAHRVHQLTLALAATPAQRLAWLEEMIALAWRVGGHHGKACLLADTNLDFDRQHKGSLYARAGILRPSAVVGPLA